MIDISRLEIYRETTALKPKEPKAGFPAVSGRHIPHLPTPTAASSSWAQTKRMAGSLYPPD